MGSPDFAVPALEMLHQNEDVDLVGVASNPDKRRGRGGKTSPTPVKVKALDLSVQVFDVHSTKDDSFIDWLEMLAPDLLIVIAFRILPPQVLEIPKIGSINVHASLLPKFRGAAPIHHALMQGEKETGLTSFFLNEQMDAGKCIHQVKTEVGVNETTGEVYARLMNMSALFLKETLNKVLAPSLELIEQDESLASPAPKLFDEHCRIDWSKPAEVVHNQIRGLSPFPGAYAYSSEGIRYNIIRTLLPTEQEFSISARVGELERLNKKDVAIVCGSGYLILDTVKAEGKKAMSGLDALNGKPDLRFRV